MKNKRGGKRRQSPKGYRFVWDINHKKGFFFFIRLGGREKQNVRDHELNKRLNKFHNRK